MTRNSKGNKSCSCKIAELIVEIPTAGGIAPRLGDYLFNTAQKADIIIDSSRYDAISKKSLDLDFETVAYLDSGLQFYRQLLNFDGMMLHASAVALDGKAYLFSGPCGMGKSTHTRLWQELFGERAKVFNDDKPALRRLDDGWFAYGTPWCGKDGININMKVPLAGICFLKRGEENVIRRLTEYEAMTYVIRQTLRKYQSEEQLDLTLKLVNKLIKEVPIYEFYNRPVIEAACLSFETMHGGSMKENL